MLSVLALIIGLVTGLGAIVFRLLVAVVHNLAFQGQLSSAYDANVFDANPPWGLGLILVPVIGGLGVVWLVKTFAPEAKGHGVPEVIDAVYFKQGIIRPVVAVVKSLASALSIGTGASVGREGPIIQIGAALGSTLAQWTRLPTAQRIALLSAGAGAGIAATFNTPLGAVMFAVELMMPEISVATFIPVVIATGTATYVGRLAFGLQPAFMVPVASLPDADPAQVGTLALVVVLGGLCGLAAWAFIRGLVLAEHAFARLPVNDYLRNALGMGMVGLLLYGLQRQTGHSFVGGTGYAAIQTVLQGAMVSLPLLAGLFVAKLFATSVSLGCGASGGVFAPSLFLGTTLGGAFGVVVGLVFPDSGLSVMEAAMIGMASVNAGATGAALTAIIMVFEMTRDYNIIVPMVVAVAVAVGVRRLLLSENIYTVKLVPRGHRVPKDRHSNMFLIHPARALLSGAPRFLEGTLTASEAAAGLSADDGGGAIIVTAGARIRGIIPDAAAILCLARGAPEMPISSIAHRRFVVAHGETVMHDILHRMGRHRSDVVLVVGRRVGVPRVSDVRGVIAKQHIADSVLESLQGTGN
jgi:CIC family chloride channel protein